MSVIAAQRQIFQFKYLCLHSFYFTIRVTTVTTVPLEVPQEVHSLPVRGNLYSHYRSLNYWAFYLQSGFSQKQYLEVHMLKKSLEVEPGPMIIAE